MANTPHELAEEFPQEVDRMRELAQEDARFKSLSDRYHDLNRAIHRAETNVEPTDQFHESEMRKERLRLKDEIARFLSTGT